VTPFALNQASRFRPSPPPDLASAGYAEDFNEVKSLGIMDSTTRTPDQSEVGRFWNGAIQNYWNEIAQSASLALGLTTPRTARLFALLNLSFADGVIAFYDAKYAYNFWRPVTAIRAASTDINPQTAPDPNWLPQSGNTAPDPSYPGAHAVISAAGAAVLSFALETDELDFIVTSEVLPGVERSFSTFSAAAQEAALSRVFAGQHFRFDQTAGQRLGQQTADFVAEHLLLPRHREHESSNDNEQ
jgi:membrane-associated phospholipid phosphatase